MRASHFNQNGGPRIEIGVETQTVDFLFFKNYISGSWLHFPFQPGGLGGLVCPPEDRVSGEPNLKIVSSNMFGVQEQVQSATSVSPEEDIVWTQLLLGSIYGMGQVTLFVFKY